ncbi:MAG: GH3 auxin-responsive promoter family protein [Cyclobacteriaceae bacterium]
MKKRIHQIELFMKYPHDVQRDLLFDLVDMAQKTEIGQKYGFKSIFTVDQFRERVPIFTYEQLYPYIERKLKGEKNILWATDIRWFAKSSGTTNAKSKFIPVSPEALEDCHFKAGKDMLSLYVNNFNPNAKLFKGKGISLGGTHQANPWDPETKFGDVSAVIMENLPVWAQIIRAPKLKTALMDEWEAKIDIMAKETMHENITGIAGVPTWTVVLIRKILELTGASSITEVWPNLELFIHGAVAFGPYETLFEELIPKKISYLNTYTASEGFFGIQDQPDRDDMLLMLDYGIFYEFIPFYEIEKENPQTKTLDEVVINEMYALVITTNAGLWRYKIGDVISFTSVDPFRIKIVGRTKQFINAFGEEMVVENTDRAITEACKKTSASISDYSVAPIFLSSTEKGAHEWVIEFEKIPNDKNDFERALDENLQSINSDYEAKRHKSMALDKPVIHFVPQGTFYKWMESRNKLGGQYKVPRLSNTREYVDSILEIMKTKECPTSD